MSAGLLVLATLAFAAGGLEGTTEGQAPRDRGEKGREERGCEGLVPFRLTLETFWSREEFPKQYPLYRPAAQWSKLVGMLVFLHAHLTRLHHSCS